MPTNGGRPPPPTQRSSRSAPRAAATAIRERPASPVQCRPRSDAPPDPDVVAARVGEGELPHAPRLILDRGDGQAGSEQLGMPVVDAGHDEIAPRRIRPGVEAVALIE